MNIFNTVMVYLVMHRYVILPYVSMAPAFYSDAMPRLAARSHRNDQERFYNYRKFYSYDDLQEQMKRYLRRSNNTPMAVLDWKSPVLCFPGTPPTKQTGERPSD